MLEHIQVQDDVDTILLPWFSKTKKPTKDNHSTFPLSPTAPSLNQPWRQVHLLAVAEPPWLPGDFLSLVQLCKQKDVHPAAPKSLLRVLWHGKLQIKQVPHPQLLTVPSAYTWAAWEAPALLAEVPLWGFLHRFGTGPRVHTQLCELEMAVPGFSAPAYTAE